MRTWSGPVDPGRFDQDHFSFIKNGVYSAFRMICYVRAYRLRTYVHSEKPQFSHIRNHRSQEGRDSLSRGFCDTLPVALLPASVWAEPGIGPYRVKSFTTTGAGQLTPRPTPPDAVAEVESLVAAGLVAAIFSVVGLGIKQLAAVSAAELPDAITACFIHGL